MRVVIVARQGGRTPAGEWGGAFAEGLAHHSVRARLAPRPEPCDLLVLWGVRRKQDIETQRQRGGEICILERGYLGDRMKWTSVSFGGGLNGKGEFRGTSDDPARFRRHFGMQPWRRQDGYALLIGQVPGDMSLAGTDVARWYRRTAGELTAAGFDVRFRPHPVAENRGLRVRVPGVKLATGTLQEALAGAAVCVCFNSNTAVDAVLAGVPAITADRGSMAWEVTTHSVAEGVVMPDREAWAARLAWKQWTLDEMRSGECWARISGDVGAVAA